jgi:DNA helicase II / ATP-dependent DNA helicase PcrA
MKSELFLGPPGTGKTTRLIQEVKAALADGLPVSSVAFVSFTRKAANEAADRAKKELGEATPEHFRTIHSMAYRALGINSDEVMDFEDYRLIGRALNLKFSKYTSVEEAAIGAQTTGDRVRAMFEYARAKGVDPMAVWYGESEEVGERQFKRYVDTLHQYKMDTGKMDFNDMLELVVTKEPVDVALAVIDEVQDLSTLQWKAVRHLFQNAKRVIYAGDDDQAIFKWAGADIPQFLGLNAEKTVLSQSYRVPGAVHQFAGRLVKRISERYGKEWSPRTEEGALHRAGAPENIDLSVPGTHYLLARNGYLLREWVAVCRQQGVPYTLRTNPAAKPKHLRAIRTWEALRRGQDVLPRDRALVEQLTDKVSMGHLSTGSAPIWFEALTGIPYEDAVFYRQALRRGHNLDETPRVTINTVHGVKGGEADHVAILTDRSQKTTLAAEKFPDDEHRVFYVAATRARKSLTVVAPQGTHYYQV